MGGVGCRSGSDVERVERGSDPRPRQRPEHFAGSGFSGSDGWESHWSPKSARWPLEDPLDGDLQLGATPRRHVVLALDEPECRVTKVLVRHECGRLSVLLELLAVTPHCFTCTYATECVLVECESYLLRDVISHVP